ncbi:MAG: PLP-dependent aminotransferase family protein [bacterium]
MDFHVSLVDRTNLSAEVYRQLRQAIIDGRLRPGDALPATRALAKSLSVSRSTVTLAYERLSGEGYVASRIGAGTFVTAKLTRPKDVAAPRGPNGALRPSARWDEIPLPTAFAKPARFEFRSGLPETSLFPHKAWLRLFAHALRSDDILSTKYGEPAGHPDLRVAIARHIGISRGMSVSCDDVTVTSGTQQALDLIARVLVEPGDCVAVEDPGYAPARRLFASLGARVIGVPVDDEGLVVDALPGDARLVYVTPSHQYPLGMAMSLSRRRALLAWAQRADAAIIEDDYDSEFRFGGKPLEPLQTLDSSGRVIYVGSFSKTLLPTLRLGFVVTPPSIRDALRKAKFVSDWHTSLPVQAALARFMEEGGFARHVHRLNTVYRARRALVTEYLREELSEHLTLIPSDAGIHVAALARTASARAMADVAQRAYEADVAIQDLAMFAVSEPPRAGLVLGYGAIATRDVLEGLRRLRRCF